MGTGTSRDGVFRRDSKRWRESQSPFFSQPLRMTEPAWIPCRAPCAGPREGSIASEARLRYAHHSGWLSLCDGRGDAGTRYQRVAESRKLAGMGDALAGGCFGSRQAGFLRQLPWLLATVLFLLVLFHTAWLCDDAFILFRTADNFVHGQGLTWNVEERVQAYTHPLWLLLFSAVYCGYSRAVSTRRLPLRGPSR